MNTFQKLAKRYGHDIDRLKAGDEIQTTHTVESLEALRDLLHDGSGDDERKQRLKDFNKNHEAEMDHRNTDIDAVHLRAAAMIHADHELHPDDKQMLSGMFPSKVRLVSANDKAINSEWNLGTSTIVAHNINTLTMTDAAYIVAYNTHLTLTVQTLVNNVTSSPVPYTVGLFGVAGAAGAAGTTGSAGSSGTNGSSAGTPSPGVCTGARTPSAGGAGKDGKAGGDGSQGGDGLPSLVAALSINALTGNPVALYNQSGTGGSGGVGGAGGNGGSGGKGGDGCQSGCEGTSSASGGNGGNGGNGGIGGDGGSGVNGQQINLNLGSGITSGQVTYSGVQARSGIGGVGGNGGSAGSGGSGGSSSGKHRSGGAHGNPGTNGSPGGNGDAGKFSGNAAPISGLPS